MNAVSLDPDVRARLLALIRDVPDFPQPGVLFRDIAPLLRDGFGLALEALQAQLTRTEWAQIDAIAGIDARGFILGAGLAAKMGKGFVPVRKTGKLPPPFEQIDYQLEYGSGVLEMHRGVGRVLLLDDVLATGGTLSAAAELTERAGYSIGGVLVLIDLRLTSRWAWRDQPVRAVLEY